MEIKNPTCYQVCDYWTFPNRYEVVRGWWQAHGMGETFPENVIPKTACFALRNGEPVAFMSCGLDNSVGKATIETVLTSPGLSVAKARQVLIFLENAIISTIKQWDYHYLQCFAHPAIARFMKRDGWQPQGMVEFLVKTI